MLRGQLRKWLSTLEPDPGNAGEGKHVSE